MESAVLRPVRYRSIAGLAVTTALLFMPAAVSAQTPAADSARRAADGVYTAAQASRGEATFRSSCANCHGITQFNGPDFRKLWSERPIYELFDQLRNTMPLDNPGGFSREEYAAVIAYVLKLNGYPPGSSELPASDSALKRVRFP